MAASRHDHPSVQDLLEDQSARWQRGERFFVEEYLTRHAALSDNADAALDLILNEVLLRRQFGEAPAVEEYVDRFPQWETPLRQQFQVENAIDGAYSSSLAESASGQTTLPSAPPAQADRIVSLPGYEIMGELGRGAMGVVYKARHLALDRIVALKMIRAGGHAGPDELARFRIEAQAVARMQHPNIVQIHDVGEVEGHPYCAFEYVNGGTLAGKLGHEIMSPRDAASLVESLARAMHAAHDRNVVHRDLKPANVLLAADGTPKITDFGLARQLDSDSGQTQSGAVLGTPSYMAPEQASGHAREAGPSVDIYALGAILYTCLTGRPPFQGKSIFETLDQVRNEEPVPPSRVRSKVPHDLETICSKAMSKEPARRYASAADLAADLRRFLADKPIAARPVGVTEKAWRRIRRSPALFGLAAAVVVLGGIVLAATVMGLRPWPGADADTSSDDLLSAVAELDRSDPDWRLEQIEAKRKVVPDDRNGALQIARFRTLVSEESNGTVADGRETIDPKVRERLLAIDMQPPRLRLGDADAKLFRDEWKRFERVLPAARRMKEYPSGRFHINFARDAYSTKMTDWAAGRYLADLLRLDALMQIDEGNRTAAMASCEALLNVGRAYTDEPFAHIQWQGMIVFHQALHVLERLVAQCDLSQTELAAFQQVLMDVAKMPVLLTMARGDRAANHYFLTSLEAGDPLGSSILPSINIKDRSELPGGKDLRRFHAWLLRHWTEFVAISRQPPEDQAPLLTALDEKCATAPLAGTPLFKALTRTSIEAVAVTRQVAELRGAAAALAVERYRIAQGQWPPELSALVPAFMERVPRDPYDGRPLRYRQAGDRVVVYCLGPDLIDNQGNVDRTALTTVPPYLQKVKMNDYLKEIPKEPSVGVDLGFRIYAPAMRR
jgi:hypothetical protein